MLSKYRKYIPWVIPVLSIIFLTTLYFYANQDEKVPLGTISSLNEAEGIWYRTSISSYRLIVDMEMLDEKRRNIIEVIEGQVASAVDMTWDAEQKTWGAASPLSEEELKFLTVPGLFEIVRVDLLKGQREEVRVDLAGTPPFPRLIILGRALDDEGIPTNSTEARIIVQEFTPLDK